MKLIFGYFRKEKLEDFKFTLNYLITYFIILYIKNFLFIFLIKMSTHGHKNKISNTVCILTMGHEIDYMQQ